jgi:hypothetical protein
MNLIFNTDPVVGVDLDQLQNIDLFLDMLEMSHNIHDAVNAASKSGIQVSSYRGKDTETYLFRVGRYEITTAKRIGDDEYLIILSIVKDE